MTATKTHPRNKTERGSETDGTRHSPVRRPWILENFVKPKPANPDTKKVIDELQRLQRYRSVILKSRNMQANRLQAIVAGFIGYSSNMAEAERAKKFVEATNLIKAIVNGQEHQLEEIILSTMIGIDAFNDRLNLIEKEMIKAVQDLPEHVLAWVNHPDQRGFGELSLAQVIGETGDPGNYPNPGKLWKRFGCAPYIYADKVAMGATWKSGKNGKLPAEEWEKFGYSPRRRSISYIIGENLIKQNGKIEEGGKRKPRASGPYRNRYDKTKARYKGVHPDYSDLRCHRHGMLLATKLLLKNLWIEWNK